MVDYSKAKVYKIQSSQTELVYVGSTCSPLSKRLSSHREAFRSGINVTTASEILKHEDAIIILIEECPCDNVEQLRRRERFHIENTPNCVNINLPGRTRDEYTQANKEAIAIKHKAWLEANKESVAATAKAYQEAHKEVIQAKKKAWREANKAVIAERNGERVECECGCIITRGKLTRHRASQKHLDRVA